MNNLTKENFWNAMMEKYPTAMKLFCTFVDQYKKEVGWEKLFNATAPPGSSTKYIGGTDPVKENAPIVIHELFPAPKFHDLPLEMQMGIWDRFVQPLTKETLAQVIEDDLKALEERHAVKLVPEPHANYPLT